MRTITKWAVGSTLFATSFSCFAISFNESYYGDLSDDPYDPWHVGILQIGENHVSGNLSNWPGNGTADWDNFSFTVPVDARVVSITLEYTLYDYLHGAGFSLKQGDSWTSPTLSTFNVYENRFATQSTVFPVEQAFVASMPLLSGVYSILHGSTSTNGGSMDYNWTITVSAVPVPAAVWLLGSGMIGLLGLGSVNARLLRQRQRAIRAKGDKEGTDLFGIKGI